MIYRAFFRLVLRHVDPERAHSIAAASLRLIAAVPGALWLLRRLLAPRGQALRVRALGLGFASPLGVAAGVDKNATWFEPLLALAFGAVEVGTVTARAQPGNPRPRVTRFPAQRALLNAMGFPNDGAAAVAPRLAGDHRGVVGINVGKSKAAELDDAVADYRHSVRLLAPHADYLVLNVSSPNTPGLREMQAVERLADLIDGVREELAAVGCGALPLLVKLAPDLDDAEIERIADLALDRDLAGIVATNTTIDHGLLPAGATEGLSHGGGVSGEPLRPRALAVLRLLHARVGGRIALVAAGGIADADDAWERILAGATLLQAYSGFVYGGPLWPRRLNRGLERRLRESPWASLEEAVGKGEPAPGGGSQSART
ncbi:MAG: quinone-dependent dihydroorotate dehydrogenase [Solirubrobacterales bacterium]